MTGLFDDPFEDAPPEAAAEPAPRQPRRRVLSVSALTQQIQATLEGDFGTLWVEGELSNCRLWRTGHCYFTLTDGSSQIKGVLFRSAVRTLRFQPEDGQHVLARGKLSVYAPKGEYQLVCEFLEPRGHGALQRAFEQLKRTLHAEGLFDEGRKRRLPTLPRKVGVVTSLDGAALRDIIKVIRARHANVHLILRPSRVQGEGAPLELVRALRDVARVEGVDVVILARGGGSIEDLSAFNDEGLARAIAACPVPVVAGIGHQVDYTIADFVADVRAATPSNAAEVVVGRRDEFLAQLERLSGRLRSAASTGLRARRAAIDRLMLRRGLDIVPARVALRGRAVTDLAHRLRHTALARLQRRRTHLHGVRLRLEALDQRRHLGAMRARAAAADTRLRAQAQRLRHHADVRFRSLAGRLESLSPLAVLARGYAVCWTGDRIVRDASTVALGDHVRVRLSRGALECRVEGRGEGQ